MGVQKEYHVGFLKDWFGDKNDWDKKVPVCTIFKDFYNEDKNVDMLICLV